jgi:hypothetical protein
MEDGLIKQWSKEKGQKDQVMVDKTLGILVVQSEPRHHLIEN